MIKKFHLVFWLALLLLCPRLPAAPPTGKVLAGIDRLFTSSYKEALKGKRIGLITNHTAVNADLETSVEVFKKNSAAYGYTLAALFAPEHGITGAAHAEAMVATSKDKDEITIYSLHGKTKRPTPEMLDQVDLLVFDVQDIGSRSYTYITTLFYAMEEAAKHGKQVLVLDRPNPINGITVDGPMLEDKWRSFVGYVNTPYCHGMTVGELALFFNGEYKIGCSLIVIPMQGWKREMCFNDTGLPWIPTSPHIPEADTALYYPATGILGELQIVNIGVGYTLPFKVVGAPWIDAEKFCLELNKHHFPGVRFYPLHYQPFYGKYKGNECHGCLLVVDRKDIFMPVSTQYLIIGTLKNLYPEKFHQAIQEVKHRQEMFCKVNGTEAVFEIMTKEPYVIWKLRSLHEKEREQFKIKRQKYLIASYQTF